MAAHPVILAPGASSSSGVYQVGVDPGIHKTLSKQTRLRAGAMYSSPFQDVRQPYAEGKAQGLGSSFQARVSEKYGLGC